MCIDANLGKTEHKSVVCVLQSMCNIYSRPHDDKLKSINSHQVRGIIVIFFWRGGLNKIFF